jgi:NADH-quinone oxidoreductase subunit C
VTHEELLKEIKSRFPGTEELPVPAGQVRGGLDLQIKVPPQDIHALCEALKSTPTLGFDFPNFLTAIDWIQENRFEIVYHLFSTRHRHEITLKVSVGRDNPEVPSVTSVWPGMDWQEREVFDLFGIRFTNHPNLKRIMLWEGYPGWPLRKDYVHTRDKYDSGLEVGIPKDQGGGGQSFEPPAPAHG